MPFLRALLLALALASPALAAGSKGVQEKVLFSNLTQGHGMRQGTVRALLQDRRGNHWIATPAGLTKFDGFELTHYDASEAKNSQVPRNIVTLAQDVDDALWLGSDGEGLCRFEPGWGVRERIDVTSGLAHDCVTSLKVDASSGSLWIGTRAGLNWLDRKTFRVETIRIQPGTDLEEVLAVEDGPAGTLWVALAYRGIFRRTEGGQWSLVWKTDSDCAHMMVAPDGKLWAHLGEEGLLEISAAGNEVKSMELPRWVPDGPAREVLALEVDGFGDVWLGTGNGLLKYSVSDNRWMRFEHRSGDSGSLVEGRITCLLQDRRSYLWAGSGQGELSWCQLTRYWFPGYSAEPGGLYSNEVNGFSAGREGGVWIATGKGLNRFDLTTGEISRVPLEGGSRSTSYKEILSVLEDRSGRLWVGTRRDGLAVRLPGEEKFQFFRHASAQEGTLPEGAVAALYEDHLGQLWAAVMGNGVARFSEASGRFERFLPVGREAEMLFVNDFEGDGNQGIWLATVGGGLWHLDAESGALQPLSERYPLIPALPSDNLLDVLRSRNGDLWLGTFGGGLARLDLGKGALEKYDCWEGRLPDWSACGLVEDHSGMIWVSTGGGLLRIDPRQGGVRRFGAQDGLQSSEFHSRSALRLDDGRLLLGSAKGFNVIDPHQLPAELSPPRPLLSGLELNGETVNPSAEHGLLTKPLALTDELRIPFDARLRFSLRYGTVYYADEGQVWFRFRMDPLDMAWQKGTGDRRATYQGLKPGNYQFVVQTSRDGQNWNGATSSIRVRILPPWFRTWWANLLGLVALVGASAGLGLFIRERKILEEAATREKLEIERNQAEAALARQLQYSMLVEQTVAEFRKKLNASAIFEGTLERLSKHLRLSHCLVYWQPEGSRQGRILAEYVAQGLERTREPVLSACWRSLDSVLHSEGAVALHRRGALADEALLYEWRQLWGDDVASVLAVRTVHEERPNGILALSVCGEEREWSVDERHLAESIAGQLGLVLAQFGINEREANYRRELEEARSRADAANRAKGEFLAKMTHELRTPLNAIIGFAELMEKGDRSAEGEREGLEIITSSAEHLLGVINEVLEISKLEAGKAVVTPEEVDLQRMLGSVHRMLSVNAARKGLRFELVKLSDLPTIVEIDRAKLRQILVNLLSNAVKFTEKGGVSLRVLAQPQAGRPESGKGPERRTLELVFEVLDTGPGIAEEEIPRLFQDFVQTHVGRHAKEGTGLGLAIAKGFVEVMGGSIEVVSRQGLGSLFTVKLPALEITESQASRRDAAVSPEEGPEVQVPAGLRVLVVEDQPVNRLLLKKVLQRVGCLIEEAENGLQAIEKWQSFQPDIIFMDESMPVMQGTEATRQILARAGKARPTVISLTAFAMAEQRERALAAGCSDFLGKPFKQKDLYAMLAKYAPPHPDMKRAA